MIFCYDCRFENRSTPCLGADGRRDFDKLAAAYLAELRARQVIGARPIDAWAWECVRELAQADPRSTLFFLLVSLDKLDSATQHCMAVLAAGPLHSILDHFGEEIIAPLEVIARRSAKFRLLLSSILGPGRIDPRVWARIRAVLARSALREDDDRAANHGNGVAVASEPDAVALLNTKVLEDLGGRAQAAAIVGLA
jgi:hypothetical protein